MDIVTIAGNDQLSILGKLYPYEDDGGMEWNFELEYDGRKFYGADKDPNVALKALIDSIERYVRPLREADLKKLDDWKMGRPKPGRLPR